MATFEELRANYALDFTWDVRNHVPPHQDAQGNVDRVRTDDEDLDPQVQAVYNRINLMTFLVEGIPFDVFLNEPILTWIDNPIYKVADQGRWPGRVAPNGTPADNDIYRRASPRRDHEHFPDFPNNEPKDYHESALRQLIYFQLQAVKDAASAPSKNQAPIRLRTLWEVDVYAPTVDARLGHVYQAFKVLKDHATHGHRFCLPFVTVQELNDPNALVPKHIMDAFVAMMSGVTHYDVYTKSVRYFPHIRTGIELGKQYNIFEAPGSQTGQPGLRGGGGSNNRICNTGLSTCITNENTSCTTDANGYCTSG